ncbi:MAG TPA: iron-sulfur cluster repair di-iron protein [Thermoanaerobaculia bacterium]
MVVEETKVMTVGELAVEVPTSIRIFEAWKIDYCCGGRTPLPEACAAVGRSVEEFMVELDRAAAVPDGAARNWSAETLASMSTNIVSMYHVYTREELQAIAPLANKVLSVHGERRPELAEVVALVSDVTNDMLPHMLKEEQVLFPYVQQLEAAATAGQPAPTPFFGTVKNPVRMMMLEHDRVGELLARLRSITSDYTPPESACFSYRELYRRLAELEKQTHEHVHVENNIFFPRAVALEEEAGSASTFAFTGGTCGSACGH